MINLIGFVISPSHAFSSPRAQPHTAEQNALRRAIRRYSCRTAWAGQPHTMQATADDDHEARGRLHPHEQPFVLMAASHVSQELAGLSGRRVGRRSAAHYRQVSACAKRQLALFQMLVMHYTSYDTVHVPQYTVHVRGIPITRVCCTRSTEVIN